MNRFYFLIAIILSGMFSCGPNSTRNDLKFNALLVEYMEDPIGLEVQNPRFTWKVTSRRQSGAQRSCQVLVASDREMLEQDKGDMWDSGILQLSQSVNIGYLGKPLQSGARYFWKVRIWDTQGNQSGYSDVQWFEMGKLSPAEWTAEWISASPDSDETPELKPAPYFRKEFMIKSRVKRARLYITGLGYYKAFLNGQKIGDHELDPAFTRYDRRVKYLIYDVEEYLDRGDNCIGVVLGNGWYNQHTRSSWQLDFAAWRNSPVLLVQLEIEYNDGTKELVISDGDWKAGTGPIIFDGIRNGEHYDARKVIPGWNKVGFDDSEWTSPHIVKGPSGRLSAQLMPPIRVVREVRPVKIAYNDSVAVLDFGENIVGRLRINKLKGRDGQEIVMRYGERLDGQGKLDQKELARFIRSGETQTDRYIFMGDGPESWESSFVYHGFQYVEIEGLEAEPVVKDFTGVVLHTDLRRNGFFECSNDMFNVLQDALLNSFLGNYHGYPTDCPHREKIGWSGDAQLVAETGLYNFDLVSSYLKWIDDFADEQRADGKVPAIVPTSGWGYSYGRGPNRDHGYGPHWDGAFINIPWEMYMFTGDIGIIERYYDGFKRYMDYLEGSAEDFILDYGIDDHKPVTTITDPDILSTGYFYDLSLKMAEMAGILDKYEDQEHYMELSGEIKGAFNKRFLDTSTGVYGNGGQTSMAGAIYLDIVPDPVREKVIENLLKEIEKQNRHVDAGVVGTRYMIKALTNLGYSNIMYEIANKRDFPGWGNWIEKGATTLWQTWAGDMSLNHIMFGSIGAWFYSDLAGIKYDETDPGMHRFLIKPEVTDSLDWVNCEYESLYGTIISQWERGADSYQHTVSIPFNTSAELYLPKKYGNIFTELLGNSIDINYTLLEENDTYWILNLKPGEFVFSVVVNTE